MTKANYFLRFSFKVKVCLHCDAKLKLPCDIPNFESDAGNNDTGTKTKHTLLELKV